MPSVTRKTPSSTSRTQRRGQLRDRLLAAVEQLLAAGESYTELSVERIAAEAGVSRSTFYVYFDDKGELLRAWFQDIFGQLEDAARAWHTLPADAGQPQLRAALSRLVQLYRPHTTLMAAVVDASGYDPSVRLLVAGMMERNTATLRQHIHLGQQDGTVDAGLLADEVAAWLTWMAERGFHQLVRGASDAQVERLVDAYASIVWKTLYEGAARRR
ncbi:MAG: Transcriptional regulator, TetR family [Frankiales bacterium]|jgi:AcrR family transcriptional regulator|nr:Transcriptional regulator, TetR family [Frankiales bacterium]